jgi:hypothetical protein
VFKATLIDHWEKGCKRMRDCFSTRLIVSPTSNLSSVTVYLNPKNIHLDLTETILKHIEWPVPNIHFTTHNRWKKAKQETALMYASSDGED